MTVIIEEIYTLEEINEIAKLLMSHISHENIWLMNGQMGAGKTTLTQTLLKHLTTEEFKGSPTFSLIHEYQAEPSVTTFEKIYHFDLYRLNDLEEAWDLGVTDIWNDHTALSIIEWGEKAQDILPKKNVSLSIEILTPSRRLITVKK